MKDLLTCWLYLHTFAGIRESVVSHHGRPKPISNTWKLKCPVRTFLRKYPDKKRTRIVNMEREKGMDRKGRAMTSQDLNLHPSYW